MQLEDLPDGFRLAGKEQPGTSEYSAVYVRPETLAAANPSGAALLGVIANLSLHQDEAVAGEQFSAQGGLDRDSIEQAVREASGEATGIEVQPDDLQLEGASRTAAFRVRYAIGDTPLIEYRFRIQVGNAIANLIVTARAPASDNEPSTFRAEAQAIAAKQVARLNRARH